MDSFEGENVKDFWQKKTKTSCCGCWYMMHKQLVFSDYVKDKNKREYLIKWLEKYGNDGKNLPVEWDLGELRKGIMLGKIVRSLDNKIITYQEKCYVCICYVCIIPLFVKLLNILAFNNSAT